MYHLFPLKIDFLLSDEIINMSVFFGEMIWIFGKSFCYDSSDDESLSWTCVTKEAF